MCCLHNFASAAVGEAVHCRNDRLREILYAPGHVLTAPDKTAISRLVSQPDVLREFVYISPGTESTTGTRKNNRSNMFLLFNSLQRVNNPINHSLLHTIHF